MIPGGTDAGQKILPYYAIAREYFPILPEHAEVMPDTATGTFGLAWCYGLDDDGEPMFAVRDDIDVDVYKYVGYHESGHALMSVLARAFAKKNGITFQQAVDILRARYWAMRGFPGSWQDAQAVAEGGGGWFYYPDESWADAFGHALFSLHPFPDYVTGEWTNNFGQQPIWTHAHDAVQFFQRLMQEVGIVLTDEDKNDIAKRVASLILPEVVGAIKAGFNITLPTVINRLAAGDKRVETAEIDPV